MFEQETKELIIVHDKDTAEYASYLIQLIGLKDDKPNGTAVGTRDGSIRAAMWSVKEYRDTLSKISSDTHVLILGDAKLIEENKSHIKTEFSEYGMTFGWLGMRAVMFVDSRAYDKEEYEQFVEFAQNDQESFKKGVSDLGVIKSLAIGFPLFLLGGVIPVGVAALVRHFKMKNQYFKERNYALALHTYLYGLSKFMES